MNYIRPCPSCNVELRIPLTEGVLIIRCPRCGFGFEIVPTIDSVNFPNQDLFRENKIRNYLFKTSNSFRDKSFIKKFIEFSLYFILSLYIIKNCNLVLDEQKSIPNLDKSEIPFQSEEKDNLSPRDPEETRQPAPYSI